MAHPAYPDWRNRADAYLSHHSNAAEWCLSEVLAMLRHTGAGMRLWLEARDNSFFEQVSA